MNINLKHVQYLFSTGLADVVFQSSSNKGAHLPLSRSLEVETGIWCKVTSLQTLNLLQRRAAVDELCAGSRMREDH